MDSNSENRFTLKLIHTFNAVVWQWLRRFLHEMQRLCVSRGRDALSSLVQPKRLAARISLTTLQACHHRRLVFRSARLTCSRIGCERLGYEWLGLERITDRLWRVRLLRLPCRTYDVRPDAARPSLTYTGWRRTRCKFSRRLRIPQCDECPPKYPHHFLILNWSALLSCDP
jgi:hypothetical protein